MEVESSQPTTIDLEPGSEWRFELENEEDIAVRVSFSDVLNSNHILSGSWKGRQVSYQRGVVLASERYVSPVRNRDTS